MKRVLAQVLAIGILAVGMGAAPVHRSNPGSSTAAANKPYQVGKASWYGKAFAGRSTASGEPYDMFRFTAAHRTLPLGTLVKVTNLTNGHALVVRINDRGPMVPGRIIDLSYAAARMLNIKERGIGKVRLDLVPETEIALLTESAGSN
jgi:rare lipoprotein A